MDVQTVLSGCPYAFGISPVLPALQALSSAQGIVTWSPVTGESRLHFAVCCGTVPVRLGLSLPGPALCESGATRLFPCISVQLRLPL